MKNKLFKNPWVWISAVVLLTTLFFIFGINYTTQEERITKEISEANYCETASDCALAGSKCPFGCYIYVNEDEADRIEKLVDGYESKCVYSCIRSEGVECVDNRCQAKVTIHKTHTNNEYGFSFKYPTNVTVYKESDNEELDPLSRDAIIAWGETDETYPNPVIEGREVHYRISILEGRHPSGHEDYDKFTAIKENNDKVFTIRYRGPISSSDPIRPVVDAYNTIVDTFEISETNASNGNESPDSVLNSVTTAKPGDWYEHKISPTHLIFTPEPVEGPVVGEYYAYGEHISISSTEYDETPEQWIEGFHDLDDVLVNEYEWGQSGDTRTLRVDHEPAGADGDQTTHYLFSEPRVYVLSYYRPSHLSGKSSGRVLFQKIANQQIEKLNYEYEGDRYIIGEGNVYFITESGEEELIEEANPHTFRVLWEPAYEGCRKGTYSRDATDVFWKGEMVEEADVDSFETLINEYGKDKTHVYLRGEVQSDLDPETFEPECNYG